MSRVQARGEEHRVSYAWRGRVSWGLSRRYLADLVIYYLRNALVSALLAPGPGAQTHRSLPPPLFSGNAGLLDGKCLKEEAFRTAVLSVKVISHDFFSTLNA